jgi:hypothetical protein
MVSTLSQWKREPVAAKVPEITVLFWVIKVLTTGMGEAASDFLAGINLVLAGGLGIVGFAIGMWLQFRSSRYQAVTYWFAVAMVALFGTMAADGLHVALAVPYAASTTFYAILLAVVIYCWHRSEGTLSIHSIVTRRRDVFYWLTVLVTFAPHSSTRVTITNAGHLPPLLSTPPAPLSCPTPQRSEVSHAASWFNYTNPKIGGWTETPPARLVIVGTRDGPGPREIEYTGIPGRYPSAERPLMAPTADALAARKPSISSG